MGFIIVLLLQVRVLSLLFSSTARVSAPQQIIMQSPSEPEFMRTTEDLVTHDKYEQEVYADVRFRAAYTRYKTSDPSCVKFCRQSVAL